MLYRAGFVAVYRVNPFPDDDDFRDTPTHFPGVALFFLHRMFQ